MSLTLEDFIPFYTPIQSNKSDIVQSTLSSINSKIVYPNSTSDFYNSIPIKAEFNDLRLDPINTTTTSGLFKHQEFLSRFMNPYTPYNRVLVFHGIGTGKTCLMVSIAEMAMKLKPDHKRMVILVPSPTLKKNPEKELKGSCVNYKYLAPEYDPKTGEKYDKERREKKTEDNIKKNYLITSYNDFANSIANKTDEELIQLYNNTYFFVDEAHNILSHSKQVKENQKNFDALFRTFHTVPGIKVLLYTATPMIDDPNEIVPLLQLLLPKDQALSLSKKTFRNTFYEEDEQGHFNLIADKLKPYFYGIVSYVKSETSNVTIEEKGDVIHDVIDFMKVETCNMSSFQKNKYLEAVKLDTKSKKKEEKDKEEEKEEADEWDELIEAIPEKSSALWSNSIKASAFVFPNGEFTTENEKKYIDFIYSTTKKTIKHKETGKLITKEVQTLINIECNKQFTQYLQKNVKPTMTEDEKHEAIIKQIEICSAKFAFTIRKILESKKQNRKVYVYSNIVNGGGCILLGCLLKLFGYSDYIRETGDKDNTPSSRFALLTGSTAKLSQINELVKKDGTLNHIKNMYGSYIQVVIGSEIITEGLDFKHIRDVIILTPEWNLPPLDQAIGRAIRSTSHIDLPEDQKNINIYKLISTPSENIDDILKPSSEDFSIDAYIYNRAETKDKSIKDVEQVMKKSAFDCVLNRKRNVLPDIYNYQRLCDYDKCNYTCENVDEKYNNNTPLNELIFDTNNLLFADNSIDDIIQEIKLIFSQRFYFHFSFLQSQASIQNKNTIVLARALSKLINENIPIRNKFGFYNVLREQNNFYFLVDDSHIGNHFYLNYYAMHPIVQKQGTLSESMTLLFSSSIPFLLNHISNIISSDLDLNDKKQKIKQCLENSPSMFKTYLEDSIKTNTSDLSEVGSFLSNILFGNDRKEEKVEQTQTFDEVKFKLLRICELVMKGETPKIYFDTIKPRKKYKEGETDEESIDNRGNRGLDCGTGKLSGKQIVNTLIDVFYLCSKHDVSPPFLIQDKDYSQFDDKYFNQKKSELTQGAEKNKNDWTKTIIEARQILCDFIRCEEIMDYFDGKTNNKIINRETCFDTLKLKETAEQELKSKKSSLNWFLKSRFVLYKKEECVDLLRLFSSDTINEWYKATIKPLKTCTDIIKNVLDKNPNFIIAYLRCLNASDKKDAVCNELYNWLKENNLQQEVKQEEKKTSKK